jgi:WD40 repeat protein
VSENGLPQSQQPSRARAAINSNTQLHEQMAWPFSQDGNVSKERTRGTAGPGEKDQRQKGNKYKVVEKQENEITCIRYVRDIGLICSTFNGTIKFFDAFNFNEQWCTMNKQRKEHQHTNITVFDVSVKLGLMATGGAEGRLILIDPYALGIINGVEAHQSEILQLYIFDEQQQIITVAMDRSIGLWDASRLEKIEILKDVGDAIHTPKFSSSSFDYQRGQLFVGCQQISVWEAKTDQKVEINALQVQTLSKDVLK